MKAIGLEEVRGSENNRVRIGGTTTLHGDPKIKTEKPHTIIMFPGGNVEIARTENGNYWVHVATRENMHWEAGQIISARCDAEGRYANEANATLRAEIDKGGVNHIAFLVQPGEQR